LILTTTNHHRKIIMVVEIGRHREMIFKYSLRTLCKRSPFRKSGAGECAEGPGQTGEGDWVVAEKKNGGGAKAG